ncbi:MAG: FtsX-like permease family protein, partial [Planctomycetota bacterium]
ESAVEFVKSEGAVSGLSVRLDDYQNAPQVRRVLAKRFAPGAQLRTLGEAGDGFGQLAASGDGSRVAAVSVAGQAVVWDAATGEETDRAPLPERTTALALSPQGRLLLTAGEDGSATLHDLEADAVRLRTAGESTITAACFSPDGFLFALGRRSGAVEVWDADLGEKVADLAGPGGVSALTFGPHSERLLAAGADGTARLWDVDAGEGLAALRVGREVALVAAALSADRSRAAVGDAAGAVTLWDVESGELLGGWQAHEQAVQAIAFGGASHEILTAAEGDVRFWRIRLSPAGMVAGLYWKIGQDAAPLRQVAFASDGRRAVIVGEEGRPRLLYSGPPFSIHTWEDEQSTFLEAVAMERFLMALILSLILVVAEFFVFAIVTTMVNERRRDIGILKSVGFTRSQICVIFLIIGLAFGLVGGALGVGGGLLFADNINAVRDVVEKLTGYNPFPPTIYYFSEIPSRITPFSVILTAGGAVVCSLVFSVFPALRAARLDPVRMLHYE